MRGMGDRLRETLQLKRAEEPGWSAAARARSGMGRPAHGLQPWPASRIAAAAQQNANRYADRPCRTFKEAKGEWR
jgi:hypothetical protein